MKDSKDDGRVNRDGITQGSGHGDTEAKARDIAGQPLPEKANDDVMNKKGKAPRDENNDHGDLSRNDQH